MLQLNSFNQNQLALISLLMAGLLLLTMGCTQGSDANSTIQLGSIGIYAGEGAGWGIAAKNGMDLAVSEINAKGGIKGKKIVLNHQNDSGNPANSISAFNYLVANNTTIIIGPTWSSSGMSLVKLADEKKVLLISPSLGKPEFNEQSPYIFNTWPHDFILSMRLADYVYEKGYRNVAIIGANELWVKDQTDAFTKQFTKRGGKIAITVEPIPAEKDVATDALKIEKSGADAIVSTTDGILVGTLVAKKVREQGVTLPIFSITIDRDTVTAAQGAYEGMTFLTFLNPTPEFLAKYEKEFNQSVDIGAPSAYDAVYLIAEAIEKTNSTDPTVLQQYLHTITEYNGASGKLISDGKGAFTKPYAIKTIKNGKIVDIQQNE